MSSDLWNKTTDPQPAGPADPIDFSDDIITADQFRELTARFKLPEGQYRFRVLSTERKAPTPELYGGDTAVLEIVQGPAGIQPPDGGWPSRTIWFRVYLNPDEGQRKNQDAGRKDKASLIQACGIELGPTINLGEALKLCVGREVYGTVIHRAAKKDPQGEKYENIGRFRPCTA